MLILNRRQLYRIVQVYLDDYNRCRPHPGIEQQIPEYLAENNPWPTRKPGGKITSAPVLSGLHHSYDRAAAGLY